MKFGSVCSGIEAASVAWHPLGWKAAWLSEIEPFPSAVLAHHYPGIPNLGDMTALPERILSGEVEAPDLFCGGTPCQAFSVAGLRNSLDDARGNLSLTFVGIANAIDHVRSARGEPASIVFWENVPGVLSTKDNAFGCFLAGLAGEDNRLEPPRGKWTNVGYVLGPKRAVAWRILDAQYFGVAQQRRRVFVVASAQDDFDPAAVLFEFDGVRGDTAPSRQAGETVTPTIRAGATNGGPGHGARSGDSKDELIVPVAMAHGQGGAEIGFDRSPTLTCNHEAPIVSQPGNLSRGAGAAPSSEVFPTLKSDHGRGASDQDPHVMHPIAFYPTQDPISSTDGTTHGLGCGSSGGQASVAVATPINTQMATRGPDTSNTPREGLGIGKSGDPAFTLQASHHHAAQMGMAVRRLTPVECERLQGFPDTYTQIPWRKKSADECPDGPRYKALGNSWAVPVVRWIGSRINKSMK